MVPLSDLYTPDWNPRKFIVESDTDDLAAFMEAGGKIDRILIWKGNGQAPWAIIEGQRRFLAAKRLGWTHLEAEEVDCTLEEAQSRASASSNQVALHWLDRYENWDNRMNDFKQQHPDGKRDLVDWAPLLGTNKQILSRAMLLMKVLNGRARALIREHLKNPPKLKPSSNEGFKGSSVTNGDSSINEDDKTSPKKPEVWILKDGPARPLVALLANREKEEAQDLALKILPLVIVGQWTAAKVAAAVKHVNEGKDIAGFNPALAKEGPGRADGFEKTRRCGSPQQAGKGHYGRAWRAQRSGRQGLGQTLRRVRQAHRRQAQGRSGDYGEEEIQDPGVQEDKSPGTPGPGGWLALQTHPGHLGSCGPLVEPGLVRHVP